MAHPVGLVNPGSTCFMNAALQALFNLPSIQALLQSDSGANDSLLQALSRLYVCVHPLDQPVKLQAHDPSWFMKLCGHKTSMWSSGQQQDAVEFIQFLLDQVAEIKSSFIFESTFTRLCDPKTCPVPTMHREKDTALRLKYEQSSSSIISMLVNQPFQGPSCSKCGGYCMQWTMPTPPSVLLMQLPRFTENHKKNDTMISFPCPLQHPFIRADYELKSVISHYGGTFGGHYKAFVRCGLDWFECNDAVIQRVSFENTVHDNNAYALLYHRVNNKVSNSPVDTQKFVQTKDECEMEPPDNDSEASDSDRDAAFERLGKIILDVASTITSDDDNEASDSDRDAAFERLGKIILDVASTITSDDDSEATEAPTDTPFQNPEKITSNVDGRKTSNMYKDAFEVITMGFAKYDLNLAQIYESRKADLQAKVADASGPPDQKVQMELDRIQDEQDQFISIIDDLIARLHEFLPNHVVKRWEEIFNSVSEAAIGKETEVDSEVQAEVQAQESDDDLLPNTAEIEW